MFAHFSATNWIVIVGSVVFGLFTGQGQPLFFRLMYTIAAFGFGVSAAMGAYLHEPPGGFIAWLIAMTFLALMFALRLRVKVNTGGRD